MTTPSGRISNEPEERKKEREKLPFIVATYVYASSQGQRMHSARTKSLAFIIKSSSNRNPTETKCGHYSSKKTSTLQRTHDIFIFLKYYK